LIAKFLENGINLILNDVEQLTTGGARTVV